MSRAPDPGPHTAAVHGEESQRAAYAGAMAELVAHIAHEVNQPLAAIAANAHACMRWLGAAPPNIDEACLAAERIARDARRASDVIGELRAFLSQPVEERVRVSLNEEAEGCVARFAGAARRHGIAMFVDPVEGDLHATLRRGAIVRGLDELVANAIEACIGASALREVRVRVRGPERGDAVIVVEDTGPGPRAEELQRLFEPLFSTKPRRLGLGLALARSAFEQHGGRIVAQRGADGVTRFIVTLPLVAEP